MQAETDAAPAVVVTVARLVPVAIRRAAVVWFVVPATTTQDAIMTLLHYPKYRSCSLTTPGFFNFFLLRSAEKQKTNPKHKEQIIKQTNDKW